MTGFTGSVDIAGGSGKVAGSLGQTSTLEMVSASFAADSGYFSKAVSSPTSPAYQSVYKSSLAVSWTEPSPANPTGTKYEIEVSTDSGFLVFTSSGGFYSSPGTMAGLLSGTTYYTRARASYMEGDDSAWVLYGSTVTSGYPAPLDPKINIVFASSVTFAWTQVGSNSGYLLEASSTNFDGSGIIHSSSTPSGTLQALTVWEPAGLYPNTTYYLRVGSLNSGTTEYAQTLSTSTLAVVPGAAAQAFTSVSSNAVTANWTPDANPAGTSYNLQLSTAADFSLINQTATAASTAYAMSGLLSNTTYYARVAAINGNGIITNYLALGSTITLIETPTSVYFDEVTTYSITASAYAASPAFTGMERGISGVNITTSGVYGVWGSTGNYWTTKAVKPTTIRSGVSAGVIGGKMYAIGGYDGGVTYFNTNEEYDPVSNTWATKAVMPTARGSSAAGVIGGKLYAVGGSNGSYLNTNEEYDPASNNWGTKAGMPTARYVLSVAVISGKLYAVGGQDGTGPLNTNEEYDPANNTWVTKTGMPAARSDLSAEAMGGKLYAVGGYNASYLDQNEEYDPVANTWLAKAPMPTARYDAATGVIGGKLYVLGGKDTGYLNTNEEYDPGTNTWNTKMVMLTARYCLFAGAINGRLYGVGGYNGIALNTNEEYTPGVARTFAGLTPNTLYTFKAKSRNQAGVETGESVSVSTYTLATATLPVSGAVFADVFASSATIAWSSGTALGGFNGPGASYKVQVSTTADFGLINQTATTYNLQLTTDNLLPNTTHYFRVQAYNTGGMTDYSWFTLGSTLTLATVAMPENMPVFAEVYLTSVTVNWSSGTAAGGFNGPGASYKIQISTASDFSLINQAATTDIAFTTSSLSPNTTYYARVQAYNSANVTDNSWLALGSTSTLANQVIGVKVTSVEFTSVTVSWNALPASPSSATCEGYIVQASTALEFSGVVLSSGSGINATATLIVMGLEADATYYFRVGALNWVGKPSFATTISTVTRDNILPGTVSDLAAIAVSSDTAALTWTSAGDNGSSNSLPYGSRYMVQYSTYSAVWSTAAAQVTISTGGVQPGSVQYYTVTGLSGNTTYYFRLWTVDEAGNYSALSNEAAALMPPNPVSDPQIAAVYISSFTIVWNTAGNLPGTQYFAEAANDLAFTLNTVSTITAYSNYTFINLAPNNIYFSRVKTLGTAGVDSGFVSFGSTPTLASQPTNLQAASVQVTSATISWDVNSNPDGTLYEVVVSTASDFSLINQTATTANSQQLTIGNLISNSTYYFKAAAINSGGIKSAYAVLPATYTYAAAPAKHATSFPIVSASSVTAQWLANGNPAYTQYYAGVSTAADFTGLDYGPAAWFTGTSIMVSPLNPYTTYYFQAKAKDFLGRETAYTGLGGTKTLAGTDVIPPSVTDLQTGDDTWRGALSGAYKVYFADYGSGLSKFQVRLTTAPAAGGVMITDWTDVVTNILAQTYASDWQLPGSAFTAIPENTTCYVSVRVYDNSANVTVSTDVFYVLRDTTMPTVVNNTSAAANWIAADPGPIYDVDFADALSGLRYIQYSAASQPGTAGANILGWTDIDVVASTPAYTADWGVNFTGLADAATNYISARAIDTAGNIKTVVDAFRILKNIKGPLVTITSPNTAYVSTITALTGTAVKRIDIAPVEGSELALMRSASAKYWDGAGFNAAAQFWLMALGVDVWSVDVSTFGLLENSSYTAVARSRDINGKYSAVYATFTFTIDATAPTVFLSTPTAGATIYAFGLVAGTAADTLPGAGVASVEISVKRLIDGKWWNFMTASWGNVVVSSSTAGAANWQFYPDAALKGNITSGQSYFVTAQAKDSAYPANASPFSQAGSTFTIMDSVPPGQITQITASSGTSPGKIVLTWTASGDDGAAVMLGSGQFAIQYATWSSVTLSTSAAQVLISTAGVLPGTTQYYTVTGLTPSTTYYLAMWVMDDAGLWSDPSPLVSSVSGESLNDQISGHVRMPSGTGITGVFVEAVNIIGLAARTTYTANDGLGAFIFSGVEDGIYRIQATWVANNIASSVSKDQIPVGYADVDFILSTEYELASISGTVPLAAKPMVYAGMKAAASPAETVELYQGARRIAVTRPDALGNFSIRNLLPGTYTVHFPQNPGLKDITVTLKNGENAALTPLGELLIKDSVYAYPNPARNSITFHLQSGIITTLRRVISVFGIDGGLVREIKENDTGWTSGPAAGEWKFEMSIKNLASGVYIYAVRVEDAATGSAKKILGKFAIIK